MGWNRSSLHARKTLLHTQQGTRSRSHRVSGIGVEFCRSLKYPSSMPAKPPPTQPPRSPPFMQSTPAFLPHGFSDALSLLSHNPPVYPAGHTHLVPLELVTSLKESYTQTPPCLHFIFPAVPAIEQFTLEYSQKYPLATSLSQLQMKLLVDA